jgi:hypothetical protein
MISKRSRAYAVVRSIFKLEREIRLAVIEAKTAQKKDLTGGGGHAFISDPTAGQAARLMTEVKMIKMEDGKTVYRPEAWLKVINLTYKLTPDKEADIMRRHYAGERFTSISEDGCGYALPSLYVFRTSFENLAVEIACQFGLVKVIET